MEDYYALHINGELDLHTFQPAEIPSLVPEYIRECRKKGILQVRIIHGKGKGTLRRTVHRVLDRMNEVVSYRHDETAGGWGATVAVLAPPTEHTGSTA